MSENSNKVANLSGYTAIIKRLLLFLALLAHPGHPCSKWDPTGPRIDFFARHQRVIIPALRRVGLCPEALGSTVSLAIRLDNPPRGDT